MLPCLLNSFNACQDAVEKYDEVIHNLQFAQELHKTLGGLTQEVRISVSHCLS